MSLVYQQRPIAVVYSGNDFYILDQQGIEKNNIEMSVLDSIKGPYPKIVFENPPENEEERIQYDISNQPFFPLSFYSDLWVAFPNEKVDLKPYFKIEDDSNCIDKKIISYNQVGSICFDFNKQVFRDYK
jgi:hypothetical protein